MKRARMWPLALFLTMALTGSLRADATRTQTIDLVEGWNAVFLEVTPAETDPEAAFEDTPVVQAATFFAGHSPVLFIQDPEETNWSRPGWHRWAPPGTPASRLNNLYALQSDRAYLLYSTADYTWRVTGTVRFLKRRWIPDSFNLTGFHVDETTPPTFAQFFEGSDAHSSLRIYGLTGNQWTRITDPSATNIASGRAYWVYCDGGSNHQGPLKLSLPGSGDILDFSGPLHELEIEIFNGSPNPLSFTITPVAGNPVPLLLAKRNIRGERVVTYEPLTTYAPAALERGEKDRIRLAVRRGEITDEVVFGLLKIADDLGNRFYIQVRAERL